MPKPALVKLGGSLLTDKAEEGSFQRSQAKRLVSEVAKAELPTVLLHGAGSFGHPGVARHGIGQGALTQSRRSGVAEVLSQVGLLQAQIVRLADEAGLRPVAVPLHMSVLREQGSVVGLPGAEIRRLIGEGHTPVLGGTLVRDNQTGWSVLGADELMQELAPEVEPRLAVFATDVDGIYDADPRAGAAHLLERIRPSEPPALARGSAGRGTDVTGRMAGKLDRAMAVARICPVLVVNGTVKGRLLDALKAKPVPCTRIE